MSISKQRGHDREAKRGSAGRHRIAVILKRLGPFSSRVQPLGCPCSQGGAASVPRLGGYRGRPPCPSRRRRRAERTVESGIVHVPRALSVSPRAPGIIAQRVARFDAYSTRNRLSSKTL